MESTFKLTRKYLEEQISDSKIALQKHFEGVRVHEIVITAFEDELETLPKEEEECTSTPKPEE